MKKKGKDVCTAQNWWQFQGRVGVSCTWDSHVSAYNSHYPGEKGDVTWVGDNRGSATRLGILWTRCALQGQGQMDIACTYFFKCLLLMFYTRLSQNTLHKTPHCRNGQQLS